MSGKLHSFVLLSSPLVSLNDGPRTQRKGNRGEWVRGRHGPQAHPLTILKSLLCFCLHGISISTGFKILILISQTSCSLFPVFLHNIDLPLKYLITDLFCESSGLPSPLHKKKLFDI